MKIKKQDVGKQCLVKYDDVGRVEGIIVEAEPDMDYIKLFLFHDHTLVSETPDMVIEIGDYVKPN